MDELMMKEKKFVSRSRTSQAYELFVNGLRSAADLRSLETVFMRILSHMWPETA